MSYRTSRRVATLCCLLAPLSFLAPDSLSGDISVGGNRPVTVRVPTSYDPDVPTPLLLMLHGFTGTATGVESQAKFAPLAEARGFLYAHPQGTRDSAGRTFWNATDGCCNATGSTIDDSGYLRSVIDETSAELNVDERRVFLVGWSNGGFMSYRMACDHADAIAAIVSFAGATFHDPARCTPSEPVHALQMHGTADTVIRYGGGVFFGLPRHPGAIATVEQWATYGGCSLEKDVSAPPLDLYPELAGEETTITRYQADCGPGGSAELWTTAGGNHTPPFAAIQSGGVSTSRFALHAVEWLLDHPKRPVPRASFEITQEGGASSLVVAVDASSSSTPGGTEILSYEWDFGDEGRAQGVNATHEYEDTGRYEVTLTIRTTDGGRTDIAIGRVAISCPSDDASPWTSSDVGEPDLSGGARLDADGPADFLVCASGRDISGRADEFFFLHQEATGDLAITARVSELTGGNTSSKAGVMLRASLEEDSPFAAMLVQTRSSGLQYRFRHRSSAGQSVRNTTGETIDPGDAWVRVERTGDLFRGWSSADGESWSLVDEVEIPDLPGTLRGGFAAAGRDTRPDDLDYAPLRVGVSDLKLGTAEPERRMLRGDCSGEGSVDITDAVCLLNWLFLDSPPPDCLAAANANGDSSVDISDAGYLLNFLFSGGAAPVDPFPGCGSIASDADKALGCANPPESCEAAR